jgi:hypothetical protein
MLAGELLVPTLLLGYATHYYLEVRALPRPETNLLLIEPVYFILLVCCLVFGVGRFRVVFGAASRDSAEEAPHGGGLDLRKSAAFVIMTLGYAVFMPLIGFVVMTLLYIVLLSLALGVRSIAVLAVTPPVVVGLLYLGMERWLNLPLPEGLLR